MYDVSVEGDGLVSYLNGYLRATEGGVGKRCGLETEKVRG